MFVQAQVEDYGAGFVAGYYQRLASHATDVPPPTTAWLLDQQIKAVSGGTESLSTRFAAYARDVWDPTRWTTGAIRRLRDEYGLQPAS